uniref:Endo/exonuclease/phosphatase domain-containing protein n=1 Tax=Macrostomum lignano TaxID=282301 RepID=A0A1I8FAI4_9PLAT
MWLQNGDSVSRIYARHGAPCGGRSKIKDAAADWFPEPYRIIFLRQFKQEAMDLLIHNSTLRGDLASERVLCCRNRFYIYRRVSYSYLLPVKPVTKSSRMSLRLGYILLTSVQLVGVCLYVFVRHGISQYIREVGTASMGRPLAQHDYVFWCGDFNYRNQSWQGARLSIRATSTKATQRLLQLINTILFSDEFDSSEKCRVPAYTDRVLWAQEFVREADWPWQTAHVSAENRARRNALLEAHSQCNSGPPDATSDCPAKSRAPNWTTVGTVLVELHLPDWAQNAAMADIVEDPDCPDPQPRLNATRAQSSIWLLIDRLAIAMAAAVCRHACWPPPPKSPAKSAPAPPPFAAPAETRRRHLRLPQAAAATARATAACFLFSSTEPQPPGAPQGAVARMVRFPGRGRRSRTRQIPRMMTAPRPPPQIETYRLRHPGPHPPSIRAPRRLGLSNQCGVLIRLFSIRVSSAQHPGPRTPWASATNGSSSASASGRPHRLSIRGPSSALQIRVSSASAFRVLDRLGLRTPIGTSSSGRPYRRPSHPMGMDHRPGPPGPHLLASDGVLDRRPVRFSSRRRPSRASPPPPPPRPQGSTEILSLSTLGAASNTMSSNYHSICSGSQISIAETHKPLPNPPPASPVYPTLNLRRPAHRAQAPRRRLRRRRFRDFFFGLHRALLSGSPDKNADRTAKPLSSVNKCRAPVAAAGGSGDQLLDEQLAALLNSEDEATAARAALMSAAAAGFGGSAAAAAAYSTSGVVGGAGYLVRRVSLTDLFNNCVRTVLQQGLVFTLPIFIMCILFKVLCHTVGEGFEETGISFLPRQIIHVSSGCLGLVILHHLFQEFTMLVLLLQISPHLDFPV